MEIAVSNIAWTGAQDKEAYGLLKRAGITKVEIAPGRISPQGADSSREERELFIKRLEPEGLKVCAFQALLFGKPELKIFDDRTRPACLVFLKKLCGLAKDMGAGVLVFGAPKNRDRGALGWQAALEIAVPFFRELGDYAQAQNVCIGMEPNPPDYGCNFVTNLAEGARLVEAVGCPGFRLHFDTGAMSLNREDIDRVVGDYLHLAAHFHASEPHLCNFDRPVADHVRIATALRRFGYRGIVSVEMKMQADPAENLPCLRRAAEFVREAYA
jgi:sugar phosphate isomerase/epimerase